MTEEGPGCTGEEPTPLVVPGKEDGVGVGACFDVGARVGVWAGVGVWASFSVGVTTATGCCLETRGDLTAITGGAGSGTEEPSTEIFRPSRAAGVIRPVVPLGPVTTVVPV